MAEPSSQGSNGAIIIDERNVVRSWVQHQMSNGTMTPAEAKRKLDDYDNTGKLSIGPLKDAYGDTRIIYRLAKDMEKYWGRVRFVSGKGGVDLVIIQGWPKGRSLLTAARYKVTHVKMIELQIGRPGIMAGAKESARFGMWLVCAADVADYFLNDKATLGRLLGSLTVDIPSVVVSSAVGAYVGAAAVGTVIGSIACGPLLVAFAVSVLVGVALYELDQHFGWTEKLSAIYDEGLAKWSKVRSELGEESGRLLIQFENSKVVLNMKSDAKAIAQTIREVNSNFESYLSEKFF